MIFMLLLLAPLAVAQEGTEKAGAFKKRFLEYSRHCADIDGTSIVDIMALLGAEELGFNKGKCYLYCMLNKYQVINQRGAYNKANFRLFIDSMPESRFRKSLETSSSQCFREDDLDTCQKAYKFAKCFYNAAVKNPTPS